MEVSPKNSLDPVVILGSRIWRLKHVFYALCLVFHVLTAFLLALCITLSWYWLNPEATQSSVWLGILSFSILLIFYDWKPFHLRQDSLLLWMDMRYPDSRPSIYDPKSWDNAEFRLLWFARFEEFLLELRHLEWRRARNQFSALLLPFVLTCFMWTWTGSAFLSNIWSLVKSASHAGVYLAVLQGDSDAKVGEPIYLDSANLKKIRLSRNNLIQLTYLVPFREQAPSVDLSKSSDEKPLQSFQLSPQQIDGEHAYRMEFSVSETALLFIRDFSSKAIADIEVARAPFPELTLQATEAIAKDWPDDKPVNLLITAHSKNPLQQINIVLNVNGRQYRESVQTVSGDDTLQADVQHSLSLERYVEADSASIEIRAEGIDRAVPNPGVGYSAPLVIETISSYGRYRKTLGSLREIKESLDAALSKANANLKNDTLEIMDRIQKDAGESPFFDSLDRLQIQNISTLLKQTISEPDLKKIYALNSSMGAFLEEHEMLDDRERDRDFFVAARGLSRLLQSDGPSSAVSRLASEKLLDFLSDRKKRWKVRVKRLLHPENLKMKKKVMEGEMFSNAIREIMQTNLTNQNSKQRSERLLAETVSSYRQWIDSLEAQEDKEHESLEKQRQKGLASARDELQELQKRQINVSKLMHGADSKTRSILEENWAAARMHENTNVAAGLKLEEKLKALAPESAERLSAAVEAMKLTIEKGNSGDFIAAESFADLSSRLLHQAAKKAKEDQQKKTRRDRRNSKDSYYGRSIIGGDIETQHEYRVDPRYREEVLDEVVKSDYEGESRALLNNFLKRMIR